MKRCRWVFAVPTSTGLPPRLGKYEIVMPLARGGMATIYIGRATGIGSFERNVVLKVIHQGTAPAMVQMFLEEARLAACLNHQNVAQVFEVGEDAGIHYLAMEYVHGQDLHGLLASANSAKRTIPLDLALTIVAGAAAGLDHAHNRRGASGTSLGIVHRDISPSNIMVGYDGSVKLLDFGIAKATSLPPRTESGVIKGKFAYMAPEQCRSQDVDRRSDIFALGIILYEVTTQHRCFRADSDFETMRRIVTGDFIRPSRVVNHYPAELEAIVLKALALDPHGRYQSAAALLEALETFMVASHMSVSAMAIRRFMKGLFGEPAEPWVRPRDTPPRLHVDVSRISRISRSQLGHTLDGLAPIPTMEVRNVEALRHALGLVATRPATMEIRDVTALRQALGLHPKPDLPRAPSPNAGVMVYVLVAGLLIGILLALVLLPAMIYR